MRSILVEVIDFGHSRLFNWLIRLNCFSILKTESLISEGGEKLKKKALISVLILIVSIVFSSFTMALAAPNGEQRIDASLSLGSIVSGSLTGYPALTQLCSLAGISGNPYPAPPEANNFPAPGNPEISQLRDSSRYSKITDLTIGNDHYTSGIACYVYNGLRGYSNGLAIHHFTATYYVGALGQMNNGFEGNVQMKVYGWYPGSPIEYATIHCTLQGFGVFNGQTLTLSFETTNLAVLLNGPWTGHSNKIVDV